MLLFYLIFLGHHIIQLAIALNNYVYGTHHIYSSIVFIKSTPLGGAHYPMVSIANMIYHISATTNHEYLHPLM